MLFFMWKGRQIPRWLAYTSAPSKNLSPRIGLFGFMWKFKGAYHLFGFGKALFVLVDPNTTGIVLRCDKKIHFHILK